jgi:hypothetical protein
LINEIQELLDSHWKWLRDNTVAKSVGDQWVEITTPYLDRHNDMLQIFAKQQDGQIILTDDGYVICDLLHSGCVLDSPKRQSLLKMTLAGFGVSLIDGALQVIANRENFALQKHNLIQAMLAVNDLFFLAVPMVASLFFEDVQAWLDGHDVRYTPNVKLQGKSGFTHHFEFIIPKSRRQPERILQTFNRPMRDSAEAFAFKWIDTKDSRQDDATAYAILNDQEFKVPGAVIEALRSYMITPILWSDRERISSDLAA